jgi:hypothetical protein
MATQDLINANLAALGFNNPSNQAIFNKIAQGCGVVVDNTISEIANSETVITSIITTQRYGKSDYYNAKALAFQIGDNLVIDPDTKEYVYAVIDPTKQIISQSAFEEIVSGNSSELFLKIATTDALTGDLIPLTTAQYNAFTNYFVNFTIPGLPISIVSIPGNMLNFISNATYYATYDLPTLQTNLTNSLQTFRKTFAFDGKFFDGDLSAYIKANVPGIRDFFIYNTTIDANPFAGNISLSAGYFNYNSAVLTSISYAAV